MIQEGSQSGYPFPQVCGLGNVYKPQIHEHSRHLPASRSITAIAYVDDINSRTPLLLLKDQPELHGESPLDWAKENQLIFIFLGRFWAGTNKFKGKL